VGDASGNIGSEGASSGERTEDQGELGGGNFPLFLQVFQHAAKRRKKSTAALIFAC